jgi:hypothetical protein
MSATQNHATNQSTVEPPRKKTMSAAAHAANRANAQKSTGPKSADGRARSAANSTGHGLQANPTTIFINNPDERSQFDALKARLFDQCLPEGELELQTFERYAFAVFQSDRARQLEIDTQARWLNEPTNPNLFHQMERIHKLGALHERRADKALKELTRLQADRILTLEVISEHFVLGQKVHIPATYPMMQMRRTDLTKTGAGILALKLLTLSQGCRDIISGKIKPNCDDIKVTQEDVSRLRQNVKA